MTEWGDYGISAVRYDGETRIDQVRVHKNNKGIMDNSEIWPRRDVIAALKMNFELITLIDNDQGQWVMGSKVVIDDVGGTDYIKTVKDGTTRDNLDNLPRF
ncbi:MULTISPECIES: DUF3892 domain-containing protein [Methanobacterium]|jgi:hypothetical protein|uniref:DUF3892 domain-containing protein n=1 Tax=Methanobacterium bryantii TaxID=2161 RepID=A0A2A2H733_METBR|nr:MULTISPECIES: DUF3892 domain-containing protein [Methanobacterium]OEC84964.1 hypothetical protein A9507_01135 [Methanobacterium sp. A39]PAV05114.1 hypothetical protein ASJ80_12555 [Methanobacterium bryantii]